MKPAKTAGGARRTSRPEKGKKDCRACGRRLELAQFQINQLNCTDCKKALDVISKKAREQNKKEWLAQQKSCPKKLKKMLLNYFAAVNAAKELAEAKWVELVTTSTTRKAQRKLPFALGCVPRTSSTSPLLT